MELRDGLAKVSDPEDLGRKLDELHARIQMAKALAYVALILVVLTLLAFVAQLEGRMG